MFVVDRVSLPNGTAVELTANVDVDQEYTIVIHPDSQVYIGPDATVTASTGFPVLSADPDLKLTLQGEKVWAIHNLGGTALVAVLAVSA